MAAQCDLEVLAQDEVRPSRMAAQCDSNALTQGEVQHARHHGELWQGIMDDSFDNTVVLHNPLLGLDLPPPTSGWSSDRPRAPG